uniref:penicillin-binding transpeptidase domain-containing protein n=1 Tax=Nocardiopsis halotolerans TaxID=124252 RepID=UPI000595098A
TVSIEDGDLNVASAMVGERGVRVSPLSMALAAAAVADGTWNAPTLVPEEGPDPIGDVSMDEAHLETVRTGLRDAVLNRMPQLLATGEEVYGQAARVEQDGTSLHWFVGYQGDVAFAVLAEVDPAVTLVSQHAVNAADSFLTAMANGVPTEPTGSPTGRDGVPSTGQGSPSSGDDLAGTEGAAW